MRCTFASSDVYSVSELFAVAERAGRIRASALITLHFTKQLLNQDHDYR